jgi:hypothetical protein
LVKFFARREKLSQSVGRIGVREQRTDSASSDASSRFDRLGTQVDNKTVEDRGIHRPWLRRPSTTRRKDGGLSTHHSFGGFPLQGPECRLAAAGEDLSHGEPMVPFDQFIQVDEVRAKLLRDDGTNRRLACARQPNQQHVPLHSDDSAPSDFHLALSLAT